MKKSSTAKAASNKNVQPKLTIGLDLGDRSSWYCMLDEAGEVVGEKKLGTTAKAMKEVFAAMPRSRVALETGMHSPWVSRLVSELGHEVIVAHARNVRLIGESRRKDDRLDAKMLARLARIDPQLLSTYQVNDQNGQPLKVGGLTVWDAISTTKPNNLNLSGYDTTCVPANTGPCAPVTDANGQFQEIGLSVCAAACNSGSACIKGGPTNANQIWHVGPTATITQKIGYYCDHATVNGQ